MRPQLERRAVGNTQEVNGCGSLAPAVALTTRTLLLRTKLTDNDRPPFEKIELCAREGLDSGYN